MFESIIAFFKNTKKSEKDTKPKDTAKERLHLVLMQDRANVSADFLDLMRQEIIDVIKKYIEVDENEIDVRLTNKQNTDGTTGAPALYANIPIVNIKQDGRIQEKQEEVKEEKVIQEVKQIINENQEEKQEEDREEIEENKEKTKKETKKEKKVKAKEKTEK